MQSQEIKLLKARFKTMGRKKIGMDHLARRRLLKIMSLELTDNKLVNLERMESKLRP